MVLIFQGTSNIDSTATKTAITEDSVDKEEDTVLDQSPISDQKRPYSSSSEGSETDVAGEVDHLHLR